MSIWEIEALQRCLEERYPKAPTLHAHPALADLPKRPIMPFDPPRPREVDAEALMADAFPGWVSPDDAEARLARLEAKLDELLALARSRQLSEDYERLTAEFRAQLAHTKRRAS